MSATSDHYSTEEKGVSHDEKTATAVKVVALDDGVPRTSGVLGKMWQFVNYLDSFGVEARGVERVPEEDRDHPKISDACTMWFSANMTVSTFALGALGNTIFYLGLTEAILTIVFFNLLTTIPVAIFSVWGKETGLRQMMIGRYSFGKFCIFFPVILNAIACVGWSTINTIAGAQTLNAVSDTHSLPIAAGCVLIAVVTLFVACFGYKYVHLFERYAAYPVFAIFLIVLGCASSRMEPMFGGSGRVEAASVLSFGGTVAGFSLGWASLAADYTVNFPKEASNVKVFAWTYLGLNFPMILLECIGAGVRSTFGFASDDNPTPSTGEMLRGALEPLGGFGRFLMVIIALSIIANNIPNLYSFALTLQSLHKFIQAVPRIFLVLFGTLISIILSIVGADHFENALDLMLVILAYWLAIYSVILLEEHFIFRKGSFANYNLEESYNNWSLLPNGFAAMAAVLVGIAGAVLGMSQAWFAGPIALAVGGPFGGDIGFELSGSWAAIVYPIARYAELKYFKR